MLYFDHAATSPMSEAALESYLGCAKEYYGNPGSIHELGHKAQQLLDFCRQELAHLCGCLKEELIFTSGGTEGNQLAIATLLANLPDSRKEVLVSPLEHPSVYQSLASHSDIQVKKLPLNSHGMISVPILTEALSSQTGLVIVQRVNSVTGIAQPTDALAKIAKGNGSFFHCDFVQGAGKVPPPQNPTSWCVSGHKFGGPKGSGFLYFEKEVKLKPLLNGIHQEFGYRAGTEDLPAIVALTTAFKEAESKREAQLVKYLQFNEMIRTALPQSNLWPNFPIQPAICGIYLPEVYGETALLKLSERGIYVATSSACNSHRQVDPVFEALNLKEAGQHYLRVSFGPEHQVADIKTLIQAIKKIVNNSAK